MFRIDDLQATEPMALNWRAGVQIDIADERDSMGFDRVSISAETPGQLVEFLGFHWGRSDPAWFGDMVASMYEYDPAEMFEPDDAAEGFRAVMFGDGTGQTWEGIVRADHPGTSLGLYPFVTVGTARAIAAELHSFYASPKEAHRNHTSWFEVVDYTYGTSEFVVYDWPADFDADAYDANGYPKDGDAWGTENLRDSDKYEETFPGNDYVDAGALGLVWLDESPQKKETQTS